MSYREIRVRPVVRYIVTDYQDDDKGTASSQSYGEFANVAYANEVGKALSRSLLADGAPHVVFEPARSLKIIWLRGPGEPQQNIRWELIDEDAPAPV